MSLWMGLDGSRESGTVSVKETVGMAQRNAARNLRINATVVGKVCAC